MSANNYAPPVTITVDDTGGTITLKGLIHARFTTSENIYDQISQETTRIARSYHKPLIAIAHSPAGTHTLIYTAEGEIREADDATLKDAQIDPSHYPPAPPQVAAQPVSAQLLDETQMLRQESNGYLLPVPLTLDTPATLSPLDTSSEADQSAQPLKRRRTKTRIAISAAVVIILLGTTAATYSLLRINTTPHEAHQGQSLGTVDRPPQSTYMQRANSPQSDAPQSTKPQPPQSPTKEQAPPPTPTATEAEAPPEPQLEQVATSEPNLVPPPTPAPPPSPNPPPEPDYGITDLQTSVLTGGGNGIVHVTFYLSGHGDTQATITIAGRSTTVTGTAPGSVGAIVTGVPVGTHAWTATADGLVNSGTITVY